MTKSLLVTSEFSKVFQSLYLTLQGSHKKVAAPQGILDNTFPGQDGSLLRFSNSNQRNPRTMSILIYQAQSSSFL